MQQPNIAPYPISDFMDWEFSGQLEIAPNFQRGDIWPPKAKSFLIDTILRSRPIPPLYIRLRFDPIKKRMIRQVVDGQQRLRAVLGFIRGEFPILRVHNSDFAGMYYADLPEDVRNDFQSYKFSVNLLENISDQEVHDIFTRINTFTVKANAQELRNAKFFGAFKQTVYKLAHQHYTFWRNNNILSDQNIARMADAELVSELVVCMLDGIRQTKDSDLRSFYDKYDEVFPQEDKISREFETVINIIGDIFEETLKSTEFRRIPLFYSLFLSIYDAKYGLPKSDRPKLRFTTRETKMIADNLNELNQIISAQEPPKEYVAFVNATKLSTADIGKRRLRHDFIWDEVLSRADTTLSIR